ncbi:SDR family NAD(P)-dependent oxidoreductase [Streptomyces sp. L7]|uniref:SDR family NAD(P)-dependent oxidoreductase n=1 Tax=Streptomyces sp. L7 TaxID=3423954 RepID=UPI003D99A32F
MQIDGCSALVTGGASGLGNATARALTEAGARVVILDLPSSEGEKAAVALGPHARFVAADVTDAEQVQAAVDAAGSLGPLRIVVNCAGIATAQKVIGRDGVLPLESFERVIRVNLIGTFNVVRLAAVAMAETEPVGQDVPGARSAGSSSTPPPWPRSTARSASPPTRRRRAASPR